jgi:ferritin-like metal-binding protein YciE
MGLFSSSLNLDSFATLLCAQLADLHDAEQRLMKAIPKMAEAAHEPELKEGFRRHLRETQNHVSRLEQVFQLIGQEPQTHTCKAMKGLIEEAEEIVHSAGLPAVKDAALTAAAQRIEHYEIAGYSTARTFAQHLGQQEAARLLQETLNEERMTDQRLTRLAEQSVHPEAQAGFEDYSQS